MSNKEKFKDTFGQIELPEEKLREMENLQLQKKKKAYTKPVIAFAMGIALVLLCGNMLFADSIRDADYEVVTGKITYYAAENEGEIDTEQEPVEEKERFRLRKEHVMVNNDILSESVLDVYLHENGLTYYKLADGSRWGLRIEDPAHMSVFVYEIEQEGGGSRGGIVDFHGILREINGKIYLNLDEAEAGKDITEDFSDGVVTGRFKWSSGSLDEWMEETFEYRVEGTLEDYTVDVWWVESEENE